MEKIECCLPKVMMLNVFTVVSGVGDYSINYAVNTFALG